MTIIFILANNFKIKIEKISLKTKEILILGQPEHLTN